MLQTVQSTKSYTTDYKLAADVSAKKSYFLNPIVDFIYKHIDFRLVYIHRLTLFFTPTLSEQNIITKHAALKRNILESCYFWS